MTTYDFGKNQLRSVGQQFVYLRERWQDSWVLNETIHCSEATWCLSPTVTTATLQRDYGYVKHQKQLNYDIYSKLSITGFYVKIVLQTEKHVLLAGEDEDTTPAWDSNTWYGVLCHAEDEQQGIVNYGAGPLATGRQTFHCYGLEKLLDTEYLSESWVQIGETMPLVVQLPITFNRGGQPNRSDLVAEPKNSYLFEGRDIHDPSYPERVALFWSTYHIVDYLLSWCTPKDSFATRTTLIPFKLPVADAMYLPTLDEPIVEQEGQTILALLNRLIDRRRLRAFHLEVDETTTPHEVLLRVVPWNQDIIDTGVVGVDVLLGNPHPISVLYDYSQNTTALLRQSRLQKYDRICVRGARRTSTATWHVASGFLEGAWTGTEETAYEAAASGVTGYGTWDRIKQMQRNAEVRSSAKLDAVYCWFQLPDDWPGTTLDTASSTAYYVFPGSSQSEKVPQYIHEVVWEPWLPLYEHVDYSGTKIGTETVADPPVLVYQSPKCWFKVPTDARWVSGDAIANLMESTGDSDDTDGDGKNLRWAAHVRVQPETRTLEVRVSGEQQHVIAKTDFTPLAGVDRQLGEFDYKSKLMFITATLRDNRYAEGKWPVDDSTGDTSTVEAKFGYVIYAGDGFRQDYVVPTTVLDVETDGTLITSAGGYVRDDTDLLKALARVTYEWWHADRTILTLASTQLNSQIKLGYLIIDIGDNRYGHYMWVNTVVSEMRISWPKTEENQVAGPTMEWTTGAGELDPMTLAPKEPRVLSKGKARIARSI